MKRSNVLIVIFLVVPILCAALMSFSQPAAAAETSKTRVLKAVSYVPMSETDPTMVLMKMFMDNVNSRAKGIIRIDYIGGSEVIKPSEQITALSKGVIDVLQVATYHKNVVPAVRSAELSELTPAEERANGYFDIIVNEHKKKLGVIPLCRVSSRAPFFLYTNVKIEKISDFNGLKFRSNVSYDAFFKELGIVRVPLPAGDIYTAMERKMIVGFSNPRYIVRRALQEVTKYRIDHPWWYGGSNHIYINQKVYESLPADIQKMIIDVAIKTEEQLPAVQFPMDEAEDKRQLAAGMEFIKLTPPDDKKLVELAHGVIWDKIMKDLPDLGPKIKKLITK